MKDIRIALNGTIISSFRNDGFSRVAFETLKSLSNQYDNIRIYSDYEGWGAKTFKTNRIFSESNFKGHATRFLWHQIILPRVIKKENIDVYFSPIPDGMILPPCKQITTVYDLLPLIYPESSPRIRYYYKYILPHIIKASSALVVGSESTKNDILKYFSDIKCPISVIYPGYRKEVFLKRSADEIGKVKDKYGLNGYFLTVSEIRPYKNIRTLIRSFAKIKNRELFLAVVGKKGKLEQDIESLPVELGLEKRVKFLGYVPDEDLAALYSGAIATIHPSLYEGFGLPPVEAMACGCPIIVSNTSSLPEVCGNAAVYFDPLDSGQMTSAMDSVFSDKALRDKMVYSGNIRAKMFSFDKAAIKILDIIRDL